MKSVEKPDAIVFGSNGAIGSECVRVLSEKFQVLKADRNTEFSPNSNKFSTAVWAQGLNYTRNFLDTSEQDWKDIFESNFDYVRKTVKVLLDFNLVNSPCNFIFIGSIWSELSRTNKSAYISSKSALTGLTRALAVELGERRIRVNCLLPGVIDNKMSRNNLTVDQMENLISATPTMELITENNIAQIVEFLALNESCGISGQSIIVDNGWSIARSF
ncbi:SDR family NAD(P)-dependent oxidoreductase [Candidatus Planktophila dulcis]|uniref:SDR family NAD(P)-dependent oxidoreductase n=1 Tax=Candidatus Planktophila dulcis TaxID=1884914 RepID=UPI003CFB4E50